MKKEVIQKIQARLLEEFNDGATYFKKRLIVDLRKHFNDYDEVSVLALIDLINEV